MNRADHAGVITHPVRPIKQRTKRWPWVIGGAVLALIGLGYLSDDEGDSEYDARDACRQAVEDRLVSPGSADFSRPEANELAGSGTAYRVAGHVDAENRLGASVRITYECKARHVDGTEWEIIDLQHSER